MMKKVTAFSLLFLLSVPILNMQTYLSFAMHGKYVWMLVLPVTLLLMIFTKGKADWNWFLTELKPWLPLIFVGLLLVCIHGKFSGTNILSKLLIILLAFAVLKQQVSISKTIFFRVCALNSLAISVLGGVQVWILGYPMPGYDLNQNIFAGSAILIGGCSSLSAVIAESSVSKFEKSFYLVAGLLAVVTAICTECRTVLICLIPLILISVYAIAKRFKVSLTKMFIFSIVLLIGISSGIYANSGLVERIQLIIPEITQWVNGQSGTASTSIGIRLAMYKFAFTEIFPSSPWVGVGDLPGREIAKLFNYSGIVSSFVPNWTHFHNDCIQMLVTGGLLLLCAGFATFFLLLGKSNLNPLALWLLFCGFCFGITEIFLFRQNSFISFVILWSFYRLLAKGDSLCILQCRKNS